MLRGGSVTAALVADKRARVLPWPVASWVKHAGALAAPGRGSLKHKTRNAATVEQTPVQRLLKAAPVEERSLRKVPLNQMNVTFAGSTPAVQGAGFVGVF